MSGSVPLSGFLTNDIAIYGMNLMRVYKNFTSGEIQKDYPTT